MCVPRRSCQAGGDTAHAPLLSHSFAAAGWRRRRSVGVASRGAAVCVVLPGAHSGAQHSRTRAHTRAHMRRRCMGRTREFARSKASSPHGLASEPDTSWAPRSSAWRALDMPRAVQQHTATSRRVCTCTAPRRGHKVGLTAPRWRARHSFSALAERVVVLLPPALSVRV